MIDELQSREALGLYIALHGDLKVSYRRACGYNNEILLCDWS